MFADCMIAVAFAVCFAVPAVALLDNWSLYDDEIFTYLQIKKSTVECLSFNRDKPIYYMLAHWLVQTNMQLEVAMRLPAAIAASLIAPAFFLLTRNLLPRRTRVYLATLLAMNPWIFEFSQMARFYSLMFLFAGSSVLCLLNWLHSCRQPGSRRWLLAYLALGTLGALTHTSAAMVFPAGVVAAIAFLLVADLTRACVFVKRYLWPIAGIGTIVVACGGALLISKAGYWLSATSAGNRTAFDVLIAAAMLSGLQVWALALIPLVKPPRDWTATELFMVVMIVASIVPFLALSYLGARIHIRYLLQALPFMFVLAAMHWEALVRHLKTWRFELGLGAVVLAMYVPYAASNLVDGNHLDYRKAVQFVENQDFENPIVVSSFMEAFDLYATKPHELHELDFLFVMNGGKTADMSFPGQQLETLIKKAEETGRPLLVVSAESRLILDRDARQWMGERFATLATVERPRYDHRRNQLLVYEYRPRVQTRS